jgi:putative transposase
MRYSAPTGRHQDRHPPGLSVRCHRPPDRRLGTQLARELTVDLEQAGHRFTRLIRDRDAKFTEAFDAVFASTSVEISLAAPQAPRMNAHAERLIGSIRGECRDRILIVGQRHLHRVLTEYIEHYTTLADLTKGTGSRYAPRTMTPQCPPFPTRTDGIHRRQRLGGLLNEYQAAA